MKPAAIILPGVALVCEHLWRETKDIILVFGTHLAPDKGKFSPDSVDLGCSQIPQVWGLLMLVSPHTFAAMIRDHNITELHLCFTWCCKLSTSEDRPTLWFLSLAPLSVSCKSTWNMINRHSWTRLLKCHCQRSEVVLSGCEPNIANIHLWCSVTVSFWYNIWFFVREKLLLWS